MPSSRDTGHEEKEWPERLKKANWRVAHATPGTTMFDEAVEELRAAREEWLASSSSSKPKPVGGSPDG